MIRDGVDGPELLAVERGRALAFAGGSIAFPGGRVDPADRATGADEDGGARIAALRELGEETGLTLGCGPDDLAFFAHWRPPAAAGVTRRFDTRFYLAVAPADAQVEPDGGEIVATWWATPRALLDGGRPMLFPTRCILERLAALPDVAAIRADVRRHPACLIEPTLSADGRCLTIPEGIGYPVTQAPLDRTRRD